MGLRLYRRLQIVPGVRLNLGTRATSVSFGHRGAWLTVGPHGRRRATLGFPGTGVYYTRQIGGRGGDAPTGAGLAPKPAPSALRTLAIILVVIFFAPAAIGLIASLFGR